MLKHHENKLTFTKPIPEIGKMFPYSKEFIDCMKVEERRLRDQLHQNDDDDILRRFLDVSLSPMIKLADHNRLKDVEPVLPKDHWGPDDLICKYLFANRCYPRLMFTSHGINNGRLFLYDARLLDKEDSIISMDEKVGYTMKMLEEVFSCDTHHLTGCLSNNHFYPITLGHDFKNILEGIRSSFRHLISSLLRLLTNFEKPIAASLSQGRKCLETDSTSTVGAIPTKVMIDLSKESPIKSKNEEEVMMNGIDQCISIIATIKKGG